MIAKTMLALIGLFSILLLGPFAGLVVGDLALHAELLFGMMPVLIVAFIAVMIDETLDLGGY